MFTYYEVINIDLSPSISGSGILCPVSDISWSWSWGASFPPEMSLFISADSRPECCVFWPAFGCCRNPKAGLNTFFLPFSTFFVHFEPFSVISRLKSTKNVWKETKIIFFRFCLLLKAGRHVKAGWLPEGVPRNCLFFSWFPTIFTVFQNFLIDFGLFSLIYNFF